MLLRSSSNPFMNSWPAQPKESFQETETVLQIPKPRSLSLSASPSFLSLSSSLEDSRKRMTRAFSETDLRDLSRVEKKPSSNVLLGFSDIENGAEAVGLGFQKTGSLDCTLFSSSGLGECYETRDGNGGMDDLLFGGGVDGTSGGGPYGGDDGCQGFWDSNHGYDRTELYYQKMIEANPTNSLLLSNYARFLKEVQGDLVKAEEYCGRAILESPNDGTSLSMYADLIWESQKDAPRAESYFDQAVKVSPDDCHVLASYARFLWDAEENEETREDSFCKESALSVFNGCHPPPLTAAS